MQHSGRFVVDKEGAPARAVAFDETGKGNNAEAHGYEPAIVAGRRFNARTKLNSDQLALLGTLKSEEQDDLLDDTPANRVKFLAELAEALKKSKPAAGETPAPKGGQS